MLLVQCLSWLQCAECREHRRWIERENARLRARGKKEETKRIREFVDVAYAGDPRIKAHKQRLREEREQRRREKAEAAAARAKAEETAKAEAEAAEAARAAKEAADAEEQRKARCVLWELSLAFLQRLGRGHVE